jgi:hypothetical protein
VQIYSKDYWSAINGHSDDPAQGTAEKGVAWLDLIVTALRQRLVELTEKL